MQKIHASKGFSMLELMFVLTIAIIVLLIVILYLNPALWFQTARNTHRQQDITFIADALIENAQDNGQSFLWNLPVPPDSAIEICGDALTGSCTNLLNLAPLIGIYIDTVPIDPNSEDSDAHNEHSRYFVIRDANNRITVSAPDAEDGATIEVSR